MVARLQSTPLRAVIADLDGTLLTCNSWPLFFRALMSSLLRRGRWVAAFSLAWKYLLRRSGKISHREIKYAAARIARSQFPAHDLDKLLSRLEGLVRPALMDEIARYPDALKILATAAAGEYAVPLASRLGFDRVLATMPADCAEEDYREMRGELKAAETRRMLAEEGLTAAAVYTDSHHDFPLLRAFPEADRVLVEPGESTLRKLAACPDLAKIKISKAKALDN